MKNLVQYTWKTKVAFYDFLEGRIDADEMTEVLRNMEEHAKRALPRADRKKAGMWYRFFEGDTGATTIGELRAGLRFPSHPSYAHYTEAMRLALDHSRPDNLQIYLS